MKKLLIICLLVGSINVSAQPTTPEIPELTTDYLKKSKAQKLAAWSLLGGGSVLVVAGISVALQDVYLFSFDNHDRGNHLATGTALFTLGGAAMLGSIPLFIAAAKNKKMGMTASAGLKMETITIPQQHSYVKTSYPAITIKIGLQ